MVGDSQLRLPLSAEDAAGLKAGDIVSISGTIFTGRDRIHRYLFEQRPPADAIPFDLSGGILYHCGPVIKKTDDQYKVVAAGPTTSMRVEMYEPLVIREYRIRGVMGKGGMGEGTRRALQENSCVYLHTFGGAAVYLADRIRQVLAVWKLDEFGPAEAMWFFSVTGFPAIVTMDAHGNDIHREVEASSDGKLQELLEGR